MKISKFTNSIPLFILLVLILVGCNDKNHQNSSIPLEIINVVDSYAIVGQIKEVKIKNHEYLLWDYSTGVCMIHSESCPCKK